MNWKRTLSGLLVAAMMVSVVPVSAVGDTSNDVEPMTQERVDAENEAYNDAETKLEIISMSDTHVASYESKKPAFQSIGAWAEKIGFDTDVVMIDGDVEANERLEFENSSKVFYEAVIQLVDETFGKEMTVMYAVGNHDRPGDYMMPMFAEAKEDGRPNWYFKQEDGGDYSNYHVEVNGYDFITLDYRNYSSFLNQTLEEISSAEDYDPGKPIFVQVHSGLSGTTWGGYQDIAGSAIQNALADYPQAIVMTAHSHYSNEAESGIYQDNFTVVNNGSMDYVEIPGGFENAAVDVQGKYENGEKVENERTCNFISVLEDGTTIIRRYDATNQRWMGMPWIIETQKGEDGLHYTSDQRSKIAPWFEEGAAIQVSDETDTTANLTFTQAVDDELTTSYEVTVKKVIGNQDASYTVKGEYIPDDEARSYTGSFTMYSRFYLRPYPEELKLYFSNLEPGTKYRVLVTAMDDFGNRSEPQEITFQTTGGAIDLPDTLPEGFEEGLQVDMRFENDLTDQVNTEATATPNGDVTYEEGVFESTAVRVNAGESIDLGARDAIDDLGTTGSATYSFWYKLYGMQVDQVIFGNKDWNSAPNAGMAFAIGYNDSDVTHVSGSIGDGKTWSTGTENKYTTYEGLKANDWNLLTLVVDRENKTFTTYVNGRVCKTEELPDGLTLTSGYTYHIGAGGNGTHDGLDFAMDNLRIWNRALSNDEVLAMYGVEYPDRDDTDYRALLEDVLAEAKALMAQAESGKDGVYTVSFSEAWTSRLSQEIQTVEAGMGTASDQTIQEYVSELQYLIEQTEATKTVTLDPPTTLPDSVWDGLLVDMGFENDLTDAADANAEGTTESTLSYEPGVFESTAVRVESGESISLGSRDVLDALGTDQSATFSFWYKSYASNADQVIFGNKSWGSATYAGLVFAYDYNDGDPTHISGSIGPGNGDYGQTSYIRFRGLEKDGWNMLTLKVDREAGTYTTYVNGIPYASGALHENATLTSGSPYTIGGTNLDFAMDNLRIWNRALRDEEIASVYGVDLQGESGELSVSATAGGENYTSGSKTNQDVTITAQLSGGSGSVEYTTDGQTWEDYTASITVVANETVNQTTYQFRVKGYENTQTAFSVDILKKTPAIDGVNAGETLTGNAITVPDGYTVYLDGSQDAYVSGTSIEPGQHVVRIEDEYGNTSELNVTVRDSGDDNDRPIVPPQPTGPSAGDAQGWQEIADELADAANGETVTVDMNGATEIPREALEAMAGKDVALVVELEDNVQWTIRGEDLAQADAIEDLDLGVTLDTHGIPSQVVDTVAGDGTVVQFTLAHEGAFGFPMTLTVPLGRDNAGAWANLYHYNEDAAAMDLEASVRIAADGTAAFPLTHASQYAVVIDESDHSQGSGEQHPFTDVAADAWYAQAVQYVYENGLMDGIENNQFAPEHTTTRAQLVTILYRLEGQPAVTGESGFTDVEADTWYTDAVVWAAANGIVNGVSDTRFAPGEEITRQQMAAILYRYAEAKGYDVTASADLSGHPDAETIQAYAQIPMAWACAQGLLQGFEDDTLRPAGNATRAQIATILMRFCQTVAQ